MTTHTPRSELVEAALRESLPLIQEMWDQLDRVKAVHPSAMQMFSQAIEKLEQAATPSAVGAPVVEGQRCHAGSDGDCTHPDCPQLRDGEPRKSHRHCPLDRPIPPAPVDLGEVERVPDDILKATLDFELTVVDLCHDVLDENSMRAKDAARTKLFSLITRFAGGKDGAAQISAERQRQIAKEGWTPDHDDEHDDFGLARAASCYLMHYVSTAFAFTPEYDSTAFRKAPKSWPWNNDDFRPKNARRDLVRAGALIAAEIDRLERLSTNGEAA